jgi:hypothetical protein
MHAIILYSDFTETKHNVSSMLVSDILKSFLSLGNVIAITLYSDNIHSDELLNNL